MTLTEARKILGLGPAEDPSPHLAEFKDAREHIAAMVRSAPNETLAERYQKGLLEFDQALAAVYEHLPVGEVTESPPSELIVSETPAIPHPAKTELLGTATVVPALAVAEASDVETRAKPPSRTPSYVAWFLVFFISASVGAWLYFKNEDAKDSQRLLRIAFLERLGASLVENRRWHPAVLRRQSAVGADCPWHLRF